jgi:hypothetical protein
MVRGMFETHIPRLLAGRILETEVQENEASG